MSANGKSLKAYIVRKEFPLASQYDRQWIIENQMGLWPEVFGKVAAVRFSSQFRRAAGPQTVNLRSFFPLSVIHIMPEGYHG